MAGLTYKLRVALRSCCGVCTYSEVGLVGVAGVLGSTAYLVASELGLARRRRLVGVALGVGLAKSRFV